MGHGEWGMVIGSPVDGVPKTQQFSLVAPPPSNNNNFYIQDAADDLAAAEEAAMAAGDVDMPDANASTDLEEKHAELQQRLETQKQVLLGAAQGFANLLAGDATALLLDLDTVQRVQPAPPPEGEEAPADEVWSTEELQAHAVETWHNMTLARAQGLFRRYHVAVAPIVQDVKVWVFLYQPFGVVVGVVKVV